MDNDLITAPTLNHPPRNEAEAFGAATWLWMQSADHRTLPLEALPQLLLPAIQGGQYLLVHARTATGKQPVAYMSWANLSAEAESRYLAHPLRGLQPADWRSGDRMWVTDWITPFGHTPVLYAWVRRLLQQTCFRYLHHRGNERGLRVKTYRGRAISPDQARQWWRERPMLASPRDNAISPIFFNPASAMTRKE